MPTNTTSPSTSSRAATVAIISSGVKSEAVVHSRAELLPRPEPLRQPRLLLHVLRSGLDAVDEFVQVVFDLRPLFRDCFPAHVEVVVPVVVALRIRRMRAPRLDHDGADDCGGNQGAIGVGADRPL